MKKYCEYKDSHIGWIGDIPGHWKLKTLRHYLKMVSVKGYPDEQLLSVVREQGVIVRNTESQEENHNFIPDDLSGYKLVKKGQFAINKMKSWQGSYGVSQYQGIVSPAYYVCDLNFDNKRFFNEAIRSQVYIPFFTQYSKGIRVGQWDLSPIGLKSIPFIEPPVAEQQHIVSFLDEKTAKIDEYIDKKNKEIEALKEWKKALIAHVVTKGLNTNAKMKDSGVSWIGEIPEHWELRRAKYMFKKHKRPVRDTDEVITCFRDGEVTLRKNRRTTGFTESLTEVGYQGIRKGDLVIHQMDAFAGAIGISDSDGKGTSVYHCCTPVGNFYTRFYLYVIRQMAYSGFIQSLYRGIRERSSDFNYQVFGNQFLYIPPIEEQQEIVEYIDAATTKADKMIVELTNHVESMKEYKQRLIADVVTGKINVQP
jgi:type I restriction enzyme S subunit